MTPLVSNYVLRERLRLDDTVPEADLTSLGEEATSIVVDYLKKLDHEWTVEDVPPVIRTAILMVAQHIDVGEPEPLSRGVKDLLRRQRDPALA